MPMKLNVGVSRKVGLPDYGTVGASCNLELEVEYGLPEWDLDAFRAWVRDAYIAAHQAVHDELARLRGAEAEAQEKVPARAANGAVLSNDRAAPYGGTPVRPARGEQGRAPKSATAGQVKALRAIARERDADLEAILRQDYEIGWPEELTLRQASALIDRLKGAESTSTSARRS